MQSQLDQEHIEILLKTHHYGRLACCVDNRPYIVPITYVYEDGYVYGHTNEGQKVEMMRKNPQVCFEVDEIQDFHRWRSAICWGRFEELQGQDMAHALNLMIERLTPFATPPRNEGETGLLDEVADLIKLRARKGVTYRIRLEEMSGRFERR